MKIDNVPELDGDWTYRLDDVVRKYEKYFFRGMWSESVADGPIQKTIIATPVKPPRLNWHNPEQGYWQELNYAIQVTGDGLFSAAERFVSHIEGSPFASLQAAQVACQEHADKMRQEKANQ